MFEGSAVLYDRRGMSNSTDMEFAVVARGLPRITCRQFTATEEKTISLVPGFLQHINS